MISKIKSALDLLNAKGSLEAEPNDPAARGGAKMAMGAELLADGIFGFARGSRNGGTSLVGSLLLALGAAVFIAVGMYMSPDHYPDATRIKGQVSKVVSVRDSDGKHAYSSVYSYVVQGTTYTFSSSITTGKRPTLGSPVDIVYSLAEPRNAYREDGMEGWFSWIFLGSGIFLALWAVVSLVTSIALIVVGFILFRSGHKDRLAVGESTGFIWDLISQAISTRKVG